MQKKGKQFVANTENREKKYDSTNVLKVRLELFFSLCQFLRIKYDIEFLASCIF